MHHHEYVCTVLDTVPEPAMSRAKKKHPASKPQPPEAFGI
jgi:hypothetical protein